MMNLQEWLTEEIARASDDARESHKDAMNSYGAGYDAGYLKALRMVAEKMGPQDAKVAV